MQLCTSPSLALPPFHAFISFSLSLLFLLLPSQLLFSNGYFSLCNLPSLPSPPCYLSHTVPTLIPSSKRLTFSSQTVYYYSSVCLPSFHPPAHHQRRSIPSPVLAAQSTPRRPTLSLSFPPRAISVSLPWWRLLPIQFAFHRAALKLTQNNRTNVTDPPP